MNKHISNKGQEQIYSDKWKADLLTSGNSDTLQKLSRTKWGKKYQSSFHTHTASPRTSSTYDPFDLYCERVFALVRRVFW